MRYYLYNEINKSQISVHKWIVKKKVVLLRKKSLNRFMYEKNNTTRKRN